MTVEQQNHFINVETTDYSGYLDVETVETAATSEPIKSETVERLTFAGYVFTYTKCPPGH